MLVEVNKYAKNRRVGAVPHMYVSLSVGLGYLVLTKTARFSDLANISSLSGARTGLLSLSPFGNTTDVANRNDTGDKTKKRAAMTIVLDDKDGFFSDLIERSRLLNAQVQVKSLYEGMDQEVDHTLIFSGKVDAWSLDVGNILTLRVLEE